jgi:hypothetical protein
MWELPTEGEVSKRANTKNGSGNVKAAEIRVEIKRPRGAFIRDFKAEDPT